MKCIDRPEKVIVVSRYSGVEVARIEALDAGEAGTALAWSVAIWICTRRSLWLTVSRSFFVVIRSWRDAASRKVWEGGRPNQFRGLDLDVALDMLLALNVAKTLQDLSSLRSVGL